MSTPPQEPPAKLETLVLPPLALHLLSGAISGLASCVVLQPFDLLKTRVQQAHLNPSSSSSPGLASVMGVTKDVISRDGILGLWRGTSPTILRNVPGVALYFFSLAELRAAMSNLGAFSQPSRKPNQGNVTRVLPTLTPAGDLMAGMLARTAVGFVLMPATVIKTRFESNLYQYPNIPAAFKDIVRHHGPSGLWRGLFATSLRDAPFAGIFVATYEAAKRLVEPTPYPILLHTVPAVSAAVTATLATAPFDLLKTHLQLHPNGPPSLLRNLKTVLNGNLSNSMVFFNGSGLRLVRKGLSSAIGWTIYEGLIRKWAVRT